MAAHSAEDAAGVQEAFVAAIGEQPAALCDSHLWGASWRLFKSAPDALLTRPPLLETQRGPLSALKPACLLMPVLDVDSPPNIDASQKSLDLSATELVSGADRHVALDTFQRTEAVQRFEVIVPEYPQLPAHGF